jgi:hypothetical protein
VRRRSQNKVRKQSRKKSVRRRSRKVSKKRSRKVSKKRSRKNIKRRVSKKLSRKTRRSRRRQRGGSSAAMPKAMTRANSTPSVSPLRPPDLTSGSKSEGGTAGNESKEIVDLEVKARSMGRRVAAAVAAADRLKSFPFRRRPRRSGARRSASGRLRAQSDP